MFCRMFSTVVHDGANKEVEEGKERKLNPDSPAEDCPAALLQLRWPVVIGLWILSTEERASLYCNRHARSSCSALRRTWGMPFTFLPTERLQQFAAVDRPPRAHNVRESTGSSLPQAASLSLPVLSTLKPGIDRESAVAPF